MRLKEGDRVEFKFDGLSFIGTINEIATDYDGKPQAYVIFDDEQEAWIDLIDLTPVKDTNMKKLNVTEKQYNESKYMQNRYGKLKYVNESGTLFKTSKGNVLKFMKEATAKIIANFYPVKVVGGRKFKGDCYQIPGGYTSSWGYPGSGVAPYQQSERVKIWDPISKSTDYVGQKYIEDREVSDEQYTKDFNDYADSQIENTINWCRSKSEGKSEEEIMKFAFNVLRKNRKEFLPRFEEKYNFKQDVAGEVKSTIEWANNQGWTKPKTVRIAYRACQKKALTSKPEFKDAWLKTWTDLWKNPKLVEKYAAEYVSYKKDDMDDDVSTIVHNGQVYDDDQMASESEDIFATVDKLYGKGMGSAMRDFCDKFNVDPNELINNSNLKLGRHNAWDFFCDWAENRKVNNTLADRVKQTKDVDFTGAEDNKKPNRRRRRDVTIYDAPKFNNI